MSPVPQKIVVDETCFSEEPSLGGEKPSETVIKEAVFGQEMPRFLMNESLRP